MARSRGANSVLAADFETVYGGAVAGAAVQMPFISANIGGVQALAEDDTLGQGRGQGDHTPDALDVDGDITVPLDTRYIGVWLKHFLGAPTTAAAFAASMVIPFTANIQVGDTIILNGATWTAVVSGAVGRQFVPGVDLAASLTALAAALNGSADTQTAKCTYTVTTTALTITFDTLGPTGNSFTVTATGTMATIIPAATLLGGANTHTFIDGALTLPSQRLEIGFPEVPSYAANKGSLLNTMKLTLARKGLATAILSFIAQNEVEAPASVMGSPAALSGYDRFANKTGGVRQDGTLIANLTAADFTATNNFDKIESIREDGLIDGADAAVFMGSGTAELNFATRTLLTQAIAGRPSELKYGLSRLAGEAISVTWHRVFFERPKRTVGGAAGIKATFNWKAAKDKALGKTVTIVLTNDVASY